MTEQEWHQATDEEKYAEYKRCQDPVYFYNTYFKTAEGKTPPLMTKERWEEIGKQIEYLRERQQIRWREITPSAYDGSTIQRHIEDPADWRGITIDPGKHKPYGKTPLSFNEVVQRLKKGK